jgi:hypothetical protein
MNTTTAAFAGVGQPLYKVTGQDDQDQQVWVCYTFAQSRKEAYLDVMGVQDRSATFDADRIADRIEINTEAILKLRSHKLLLRAAFDLIDIKSAVYCTRPALFDSRVRLTCTDEDSLIRHEVEFDIDRITIKRSDLDRNLPISKYLKAALDALELVKYHITTDYLSPKSKPTI